MSTHRFDRDTAVRRLADGSFEGTLDRGWWIVVGPNGGYLAATLLRALTETVSDSERAPRSLTVHYVSPASEGPVRISTRIERAGRSLSTVSARLEQGGKLVALALAAFAKPRRSPEFHDLHMPEVPPPESLERRPVGGEGVAPLRERLESRTVFGEMMRATSEHALAGGWLRPAEPRRADSLFVALLCDAWPPSVAQHRALAGADLRGMPTVELTIHFRAPVPPSAKPDDFYLGVFRSRTLRDGFFEEDGEIWTRDGLLLAQSRQLAMFV
jgi:acyl-CoA thioesterase